MPIGCTTRTSLFDERVQEKSEARTPARPLRVGFLVLDYPVISEAFIANHARGLADLGVELTILALGRSKGDEREYTAGGASFRVLGGGMPLSCLERWRKAVIHASRFHRSPMAALPFLNPLRHGRTALTLQAFYAAPLLARAGPLDVLHCQFATLGDAAVAARLAGYCSGRIIAHFRGFDITSYVQRNGEGVYRRLVGQADYFLANSEHFKKKAIVLGCDPARTSVLRSGIDLSRFEFRAPRGLSRRPLELVSVGRLVEKKGFLDVLEALAILRREGIDARYRLIGDGPLRQILEGRARDLGLAEQVEFLGAIPNAALPPLVASGDIFLAPSVMASSGDQDAPVNTLKEAMALGLPIIATRHGGIPELVLDRETGLLVPERSPGEIARAVLRLLDSPELVEILVRNGRRKVVDEYDVTRLSRELLGIYEMVLTQPSIWFRPPVASIDR